MSRTSFYTKKGFVSKQIISGVDNNAAPLEGPFLSRAGLDASLLSAWTSLKKIPVGGSGSMG